jgi:hypothetical protein
MIVRHEPEVICDMCGKTSPDKVYAVVIAPAMPIDLTYVGIRSEHDETPIVCRDCVKKLEDMLHVKGYLRWSK